MKRLLHFRYYEDTVNLLLENPTEQLVNDIKKFYEFTYYFRLGYDIVVSEIVSDNNCLLTLEQWMKYELLDIDDYEGELLEIVKSILSYKKEQES